MAEAAPDLYRRFEIEIHTPRRRLLLDALLPDPSTIESSLPVVEASKVNEEDLVFLERREEEPAPEPRPKRKPKARAAQAHRESAKSLEEEVAEFMKRDRPSALAPDDAFDAPPPVPKKED